MQKAKFSKVHRSMLIDRSCMVGWWLVTYKSVSFTYRF